MSERSRPRRAALAALACALTCGFAAAQEPEPQPEPRPRLRPELVPPPLRPEGGAEGSSEAQDAQREMLQLFRQVERRLREIDALLVDAGAGDTRRLSEVQAAGIDRLIRRSVEGGRQNLQDIDRIIEIAQQFGSQQQSSGSGQSQQQQEGQPGGSRPQGSQSTAREQTPEGPGQGGRPEGQEGQEPGSEGQRPQGEQPGQEPSQERGGTPQAGGPSEAPDPQNRPAGDPPRGATEGPGLRPDGADRWGDLPVHVRDVFRHGGSDDLPPQYRDWIDAYYRRLQRPDGRR